MATKQGLWRAAVIEFGDRQISDTGEVGETARTLKLVYDNVVAECLAATSWNFATETIKSTADTGVTPAFGYTEVFAKPTDWVMTTGVSEDENFAFPLLHYYDDANYWSANTSPLYFRYVSNDTGMGLELTRWPQRFTRYVELALASRICIRLGASANDKKRIDGELRDAKRSAMSQDAMNEPQPKFAPPGSWTMSRGGRSSRGRGSRSSLTG